jgi:hypothetical protein
MTASRGGDRPGHAIGEVPATLTEALGMSTDDLLEAIES